MRRFIILLVVFLMFPFCSSAFAESWNVKFVGTGIDYDSDGISPVTGTGVIEVNRNGSEVTVTFNISTCSGGNSNTCSYSGSFTGYGGVKTFGASDSGTNYNDLIAGAVDGSNVLTGRLIVCDLYYGPNSGATYIEFSSDPSYDTNILLGDINNDDKIGLVEAMYALQVVSGLRPEVVIAPKVPVVKTGQTTSYATGDDGVFEKGVAWPIPRFTDKGDGTVKDNLTGLIWLKDTSCINSSYPGFDIDETPGDGKMTWQHALDFVAGINNGTFPNCGGGKTDWRLPNIRELFSLGDFGNHSPALPTGHPFVNVQINDGYWSSTTGALNTNYASFWIVQTGEAWTYDKTNLFYHVWPVRDDN